MSDSLIRVIPADPVWQPTAEDAAKAVTFVEELFAGPGAGVDEVETVFYERITVIDGASSWRISSVHGPTARSGSSGSGIC
ncbi:hypothetical protein [Actinoplanes couchii]|nr:hypothetical protein [Actinoplanes couchii]